MQFEEVETLRRLPPGGFATLIPSWNTGYRLLAQPVSAGTSVGIVRPGQKLRVLAEANRYYQVSLDSAGLVGWIPGHVVAPWPD